VRSTYRYDWAALLKRVFGVDVLQCSRCQGKMRLIACIEEPDVATKILEHLGLRAEALPTLRAQAPPVTLELFPDLNPISPSTPRASTGAVRLDRRKLAIRWPPIRCSVCLSRRSGGPSCWPRLI
jgi:hypothetical protein